MVLNWMAYSTTLIKPVFVHVFWACTHGASPCLRELCAGLLLGSSPWAQDVFSVCLTPFIFNEQLSNTAISLGLGHANRITCGPLGFFWCQGLGTAQSLYTNYIMYIGLVSHFCSASTLVIVTHGGIEQQTNPNHTIWEHVLSSWMLSIDNRIGKSYGLW
jgi:hypothetical protein